MVLIKIVYSKICERGHFTISELSYEFPQISRTVLYEIIADRPGYLKFYARWVQKILTGAHGAQRMASALTFSERYDKHGDEFLNHSVRMMKPGFLWRMLKPKSSQSSGCTHIHQTSRKQTLSACKKADDNCFLG
jgi:hypothetical protein